MSLKSKGINAERELVHKFWSSGYACHRIAGSGSTKYPSPDLLVGNGATKLAIEVKTTNKSSKYFPHEEIKALKTFSKMFGAQPWVAIKFKGHNWYFFNIEDLKETNKSLVADTALAKMKGLLFEELVDK